MPSVRLNIMSSQKGQILLNKVSNNKIIGEVGGEFNSNLFSKINLSKHGMKIHH